MSKIMKLSHNPAFSCYRIPNYLEKKYLSLLKESKYILDIQNRNVNNIFSNNFLSEIQGLLYYIKFNHLLNENRFRDKVLPIENKDFNFFKEISNTHSRLELLRKDEVFKSYVMSLSNNNIVFTKSDLTGAFQLFLQLKSPELFITKRKNTERKLIDYFEEKKQILGLTNQKLKVRLLKDLIRNRQAKNNSGYLLYNIESQFRIINKVSMRKQFIESGLEMSGLYKNNVSKYNFKSKISIEPPKSVNQESFNNFKKTTGIYVFETNMDLWYIGESTQLGIRFHAHKKRIGNNIKSYNELVGLFHSEDNIKNIYFVETTNKPEMRHLYEATLQIALMGELNKRNELKGLLQNHIVKDYIEVLQ